MRLHLGKETLGHAFLGCSLQTYLWRGTAAWMLRLSMVSREAGGPRGCTIPLPVLSMGLGSGTFQCFFLCMQSFGRAQPRKGREGCHASPTAGLQPSSLLLPSPQPCLLAYSPLPPVHSLCTGRFAGLQPEKVHPSTFFPCCSLANLPTGQKKKLLISGIPFPISKSH